MTQELPIQLAGSLKQNFFAPKGQTDASREEIWSRLQHGTREWSDKRQEDFDRERARVALEELEVKETCTFRPEINGRSREITQRRRMTSKSPEAER